MKRKIAVFVGMFLTAGALVYGCSSDRPQAGGGGNTNPAGESCTTGTTRSCHGILGVSNGIKSCFEGVQECLGERWGACTSPGGQEIEIVNSPTFATSYDVSGGGGLRTLNHVDAAADAGCQPCNPDCEGWFECYKDGGAPAIDGSIVGQTGPCPNPITLTPPPDPALISGFPGVPPGHQDKMLQDGVSNYNHDCSHWPHQPGTGAPTLPFSACQGDTNCDGNDCKPFPTDGGHPVGECLGAAPDITVGNGCTISGLGEYFPICNRGSGAVAAGTQIGIFVGPSAGNLPQATAFAPADINPSLVTPAPTIFSAGCPARDATCYVTVPATGLNPGKCFTATCGGISGTKHIYVNSRQADGGPPSVTECNLDGNTLYGGSPVAPGCSNNWTVIGSPPPCNFDIIPLSFTFNYAPQCAPGTKVRWSKLSWSSIIPAGTNIKFEARTRTRLPDGGLSAFGAYTVIGNTPPDPAICLLAGPLPCPKDLSAILGDELELRISLKPDGTATVSPTLTNWGISYVCAPNE